MTGKLSNYLRTYRKQSGLSQAQLGMLLGDERVSQVSRYERGLRLPDLETVLAYEAIFGVHARDLFAGLFEEIERRTHERARLLAEELAQVPSTPEVEHRREAVERIYSLPLGDHPGGETKRIVALDPTSHGFGFVVLENPTTLIDWGHVQVEPDAHEKCMELIAQIITRYVPYAVVTEDWKSKESRRCARVRKLLEEVARFVEDSDARAVRFSWPDVKKTFSTDSTITKQEMAQKIALEFRELSYRLPPPRKLWMSEDDRMSIFDAAALALTYFHPEGEVMPSLDKFI